MCYSYSYNIMLSHKLIKSGIELKPQWECFITDGDGTMYKTIYLHYYHYLMFVGLKKRFSATKAKDALNEVFLYVWENRGQLGHVKNHHNYLLTAFLRKLYKKEKFVPEECLSADTFPDLVAISSVEAEYIAKGTQHDLSRALTNFIEQLPERQKSLIYQKFYLGLSYQEIAQANNISINTVYNTIYKAVDKLKTLIGKDHLQILALAFTVLSLFFLRFCF